MPIAELERLLGQVGVVREKALIRSFRTWIGENLT